jgi:ATP-dependent RNA helicase RhlE
MTFERFKLHTTLSENLAQLGYQEPTPIQARTIPPIMNGIDVIGLAQTGTGKTAAFLLPLIHKLVDSNKQKPPRALIVVPTRELAQQIFGCFQSLSVNTGLRGVTLYGGTSMAPQLRRLRKGVDVVVACPGRLLDHFQRGSFDPNALELVVFDEADLMLDMGFLPDIRKINKLIPTQRQTLLFSATMPPQVEHLAGQLVSNSETIEVSRTGLSATVSHSMYPVSPSQKSSLLLKVVRDLGDGSAIVFTRTRRKAEAVGKLLRKSGESATSLQGNLSQNRRKAVLDGFRAGKYKILVATDVASRGIDISEISHVVNYDMPDSVETYTHRVGRTGRADRLGEALSFATSSDRQLVRRIRGNLNVTMRELFLPKELPAVPRLSSSQTRDGSRCGRSRFRKKANAPRRRTRSAGTGRGRRRAASQ